MATKKKKIAFFSRGRTDVGDYGWPMLDTPAATEHRTLLGAIQGVEGKPGFICRSLLAKRATEAMIISSTRRRTLAVRTSPTIVSIPGSGY